MVAHQTAGTTPLNLMPTHHPPGVILPRKRDRPGTSASDKRLTALRYKGVVFQRFCSAMEGAVHRNTAAQRKYKENLYKKVRFQIEVHRGDHVCVYRPPRKAQRSEGGSTAPPMGYSNNLEETVTARSRKLLSRTMGLYNLRAVTESTAIIGTME